MNIDELLDGTFPTPGGGDTIAYLCHHLAPTQMARIIHALRFNEGENAQDAAAYRQLQQQIYHQLAENCGAEDAQQVLAATQNENHE